MSILSDPGLASSAASLSRNRIPSMPIFRGCGTNMNLAFGGKFLRANLTAQNSASRSKRIQQVKP